MSEYIDRNKVAELLCRMICGSECDLCVSACENCRQKQMVKLYEIPKTDVAPVVHAKWIKVYDEVCYSDGDCAEELVGLKCSSCKEVETDILEERDYCPNCGAIMDLEVENNAID